MVQWWKQAVWKVWILSLASAVSLACWATQPPLKSTILRLGRIPYTNATEMIKAHEPLLAYLRKELGVKEVRLVLANDYEGILAKMESGDIDIGWIATYLYATEREHYRLRPLVKPVRKGATSYRGIMITRKDSGIRKLADLRNRTIAWVEKDSASGFIFPRALLLKAGINPEKDCARTAFLNKHDAVVLNVFLGNYDAGACYDDARETLKDQGKADQLTVLATTEDIPNEPIVCREDLSRDLAERLKTALMKLSLQDPAGKSILEPLTNVQGFVEAKHADYAYVRKMAKIIRKASP